VDTELTARQREIFVAIVLNGVPLDAVAVRLGSNRNAVYKMMFDARRKLRAALAANGYMDHHASGRSRPGPGRRALPRLCPAGAARTGGAASAAGAAGAATMVMANDWHGVHVLGVNPVQQVVQQRGHTNRLHARP
jgi:hypothetical protein